MAIWDDILSERDKEVFAKAGYGSRQGFGSRPALLVVDVNYNFVGDKPEPILKSIETHRNSCGEEGWEGVYQIQKLLKVARGSGIPIFFSTGLPRQTSLDTGRWGGKNQRSVEDRSESSQLSNEIVEEIAPMEGEVVFQKQKPSVFFGTTLISYLTELHIDTLLVAGTTTSGCVRATVLDAFSYNFKVGVVEECTFDRGQISHKINLFDMNAKYADVVSREETEDYLANLPDNLFREAGALVKS